MRTEPAHDPTAPQLNEGVETANGAADNRLIKDLSRAIVPTGPVTGGGHEGFRLAGDAAAFPVGNGDVASMTEAAKAGDTMRQAEFDFARGHQMFQRVNGAGRDGSLHSGQCVHLGPEVDGVAQLALGHNAKPLVTLAQNEGFAAFAHAFSIPVEKRIAEIPGFERQVPGLDREMGAHREPNEIVGVGHRIGFVEIIDAPNETTFRIAPRTEVLYMQVAHGQYLRSFGEFGTNLWPDLCPAVV